MLLLDQSRCFSLKAMRSVAAASRLSSLTASLKAWALGFQARHTEPDFQAEGARAPIVGPSGQVCVEACLQKICLIFLLSISAFSQTAILLPSPRIQFLDSNGKPYAGGLLFTYQAGTTISQATYTDSNRTATNTNPIVLDSAGRASVFVSNAAAYKFVLQDRFGALVWTADNVTLNQLTVGGANTQVQYNCSGQLCGNSGFVFNQATQTLTITTLTVSAGGDLAGTFTGSPAFSGAVNFTGTGASSAQGVTQASTDSSTRLATDAFVKAAINASVGTGQVYGWAANGSSWQLACGVVAKTAAYPATPADCFVQASVAGGSFAITLPHLTTAVKWRITRTDSSANALTIVGDSGNINGQASIAVSSGGSADCYEDGVNGWCIVSGRSGAAVLAVKSGTTCALALNGGEWNCSGTITWPTALADANYSPICQTSYPQPGGSFAVPAGYQAKLFIQNSSITTAGFTYTVNDDHSGSLGAVYTYYCVAVE